MSIETPRIPGYTEISWLGTGGFADVYRAKREHLGRLVAIKVFRVTLADREAAGQFRSECDAVMRLDREPDVIVVHDAGILPDDRPFLVTELCDGSLLQLISRRGALPADEVTSIGHRLATALTAAHFARVLHGDVTPQNVLIRPSGAPVLADFGLAVLRDHRGNTAAGFSPAHAAPETVRHDGSLDERSDVYGLGSTLYTALTGRSPFARRDGEHDAVRLRRVLHDPPVRPEGAPDRLADLLLTMLAKDPAERPTAGAVVAALAAAASTPLAVGPRYSAPPGVAPVPPATPEPANPEPATPEPEPALADPELTEPVDAPRRSPVAAGRAVLLGAVLTVAAVVALVLVGVAGGWSGPVDAPAADPALPPTAAIALEVPLDRGTAVDLRWTADRTLDFAVIIGVENAEPRVQLVNRETAVTLEVQPDLRYCFRVQGTDGRGAVVQSDPQSIRGAVCRFDPT